MMNVRKYRAANTREALELVKQDLGEDAFVLETKRVKTGGFLGLRSRTEIEVSAATSEELGANADKTASAPVVKDRLVDLKDETAASPDFSAFLPQGAEEKTISALNARAASAEEFEDKKLISASSARPETVEINPEAPRFVFPEKEASKASNVGREAKSSTTENRASVLTNRDFELLRAEMREVKFSLGTLAALQRVAVKGGAPMDLGVFGKQVEPAINDAFVELMTSGMSSDLARRFVLDAISNSDDYSDLPNLAHASLSLAIPRSIQFENEILRGDDGAKMAIIGSTGVGKTTTAAKLAARSALYDHHRVELVTLDTYRIAAVEQLKTYAEIIGAGCHVVRTVLELEAVLNRLPKTTKILIDTTGRNPHDLADQYEFSDFLHRRDDIRKCLVVQATTHPLDAHAAIRKFDMYGADCLAITKFDETTRPGAVLETIIDSKLPLAYLGTGQRVPEDILVATPETLSNRILPIAA